VAWNLEEDHKNPSWKLTTDAAFAKLARRVFPALARLETPNSKQLSCRELAGHMSILCRSRNDWSASVDAILRSTYSSGAAGDDCLEPMMTMRCGAYTGA
jgi:hypothetical protein